ncbi:hypothetical protein E2562_017458 [Oryza meyeriana var. granulata]|uniref:Uncharacterized protein n=1 Tax=Oryza meyeriana var. granulata TaxID=110450 RepID=A0A6G1DYI3_9ORYZ|nr:hypothetical protein E2562_017458 [Oryza meyeriana var. granulata]
MWHANLDYPTPTSLSGIVFRGGGGHDGLAPHPSGQTPARAQPTPPDPLSRVRRGNPQRGGMELVARCDGEIQLEVADRFGAASRGGWHHRGTAVVETTPIWTYAGCLALSQAPLVAVPSSLHRSGRRWRRRDIWPATASPTELISAAAASLPARASSTGLPGRHRSLPFGKRVGELKLTRGSPAATAVSFPADEPANSSSRGAHRPPPPLPPFAHGRVDKLEDDGARWLWHLPSQFPGTGLPTALSSPLSMEERGKSEEG